MYRLKQRGFALICFYSVIFCLLLLLAVFPAAQGATVEETIAVNFLRFLGSDKAILSQETLEQSLLDPALPPVTVAHLFNLQDGGYLLVSTDRSISPVKAYSLTGDFAALPEPYWRAILAELELRVRVAASSTARAPLTTTMTETESQWDFLLRFDTLRMPLDAYVAGTNLLTTQWNQSYPYNKFLPAVGSQTVLTGCVNVAVGQVMRYYKYPAASKGVASYTWSGPPSQTLKTILYRSYNWDNMPNAIDAATPEYQTDEVALLLKDLGIANQTNFGVIDSAAIFKANILTENFGYSTDLASMKNNDYSAFLTTLQGEIAALRPVLLTFPGHMTVADGYRNDQPGTSVHVNMGWGGSYDNFYFLNAPVVAGGYNFSTAAGQLEILYNIKPCTEGGDCAVNLEQPGDSINGLAITGNFDRADDTDIYEVYLKGVTTLQASRGYSNIAFFVSIIRAADGSVALPPPDPDNTSLGNTLINVGDLGAAEKYLIRISLYNTDGSFYPMYQGHNYYNVTLTSQTVTPEEKTIADQALQISPVIGNTFPDLLLNTSAPSRKILIDARDENGDTVTLHVSSSNWAAVRTVLTGNVLELIPTGTAKISSRIVVTATANGQTTEKSFTVMTDNSDTAFGKSFTVGGTFTGQSDVQIRRAILDGACTITGQTIGYSNQGFFSSVLDASGNVIASVDGSISGSSIDYTFSQGVYSLRASLCTATAGGGTSCYPYTLPGVGDRYTFAVTCNNADAATVTIAGLLTISLDGANQPIITTGDINGDNLVTLADAILALQLLGGVDVTNATIRIEADVNGDLKIGMAEAIFILQTVAELRIP